MSNYININKTNNLSGPNIKYYISHRHYDVLNIINWHVLSENMYFMTMMFDWFRHVWMYPWAIYIFVMICIMFKNTTENCLNIIRLHMLPVTPRDVQKVYCKLHWMKSVIILSYFINYYNKIVIIKVIWRERNSHMLIENIKIVCHELGIVF